jgi:hypothetical protein
VISARISIQPNHLSKSSTAINNYADDSVKWSDTPKRLLGKNTDFWVNNDFSGKALPAEILRLFCAGRLVLFGWFVGSTKGVRPK